jgi:hypothetical protein
MEAQVQAYIGLPRLGRRPPLPPFRDGKVDGGTARGAAREGASALREGTTWEEASHVGKTSEQALHAGEGAGKREHPTATLRQ